MNTTERAEIKSIIEKYREIHIELNRYEKDLDDMSSGISEKEEFSILLIGKRIKECISKLESEREREKKLFSVLESKYGPGEFDINSFEYKLKK